MLTLKTIFGAAWSVSARLSGRIIDFVTLLLLARILSPADFGVVALALTLVSIAETVLEVPLSQALTRLKEISKAHLDTAFTLGLLRGGLFSLVILAAAWPFAQIYHDDRLMAVVAALGIGPVARGLYSPAMVEFTRQLRFREVFITQVLGKVFAAALAATVLFMGGGYWAIIVNNVASAVGATVFSYVLAPMFPALTLARFRDFAGFMSWFSSMQVVTAFTWQFDRILLGNFITKTELGKFSMANDIAVLPTQSLIGPAMQPIMSAFASISHDIERLKTAYLKATFYTMLLAVAASVFMAITADLVVAVLLGPQWHGAELYLAWLALAAIPSAYIQPLASLAVALDRPKSTFLITLADLAFRLVLTPIGLFLFSVEGVIGARAIASALLLVVCMLSARALLKVGVVAQLKNLWRVVAAVAASSAVVLALRSVLDPVQLGAFISLAIIGVVGGLAYIGCLFVLGVRPLALLRAKT